MPPEKTGFANIANTLQSRRGIRGREMPQDSNRFVLTFVNPSQAISLRLHPCFAAATVIQRRVCSPRCEASIANVTNPRNDIWYARIA
jgi:hypothetical protein